MKDNKFSSGRIDLHTHSTASDGSLTPSELVQAAHKTGLKALALTDHDTVGGLPEAIAEADKVGLTLIPGVEISCNLESRALHMLGYWVDPFDEKLNAVLGELVDYRTNRNLLIISRLNELGIDISYKDVAVLAGNEVVGRPHFALAMVNGGHVENTQQAFDEYLAKGKPAYLNKKRLTAAQGIELIAGAGGIPALAHPSHYELEGEAELRAVVAELKSYGLKGLEVWYSTHTRRQSELYLRTASEFGLVATGGSDFHGDSKPEIKLGTGINGNLNIDFSVVDNLRRFR